MVPLVTVTNGFQAQVLIARLGAAGVLAQPRGALGGPYPIGDVLVDVAEEDAELARQLLLADEVEAVFSTEAAPVATRRRHALAPWVIVGAAVMTEAVAVATHL